VLVGAEWGLRWRELLGLEVRDFTENFRVILKSRSARKLRRFLRGRDLGGPHPSLNDQHGKSLMRRFDSRLGFLVTTVP